MTTYTAEHAMSKLHGKVLRELETATKAATESLEAYQEAVKQAEGHSTHMVKALWDDYMYASGYKAAVEYLLNQMPK